MNHRMGFNPLSRTSAHRRAMTRNMVTSLFRFERITTTKAKALEVKKTAEKLITRSKVDSVHNRRQVARFIQDEIVLAKLFTNIGPRMKDRPGGYTRVLKLGFRQGDAAEMVILELVDFSLDGKNAAKEKKAAAKAEKAEKKEAAKKDKADTKAKSGAKSKTDAKPKAKAESKPKAETKAKAKVEEKVEDKAEAEE